LKVANKLNDLSHHNAPQYFSDKMRALCQALLIKLAEQEHPLVSCAKGKQKQLKTSVFLNAGLCKEGDMNTYGFIYNFLIRLSPQQRITFGERFQDWLDKQYAPPPLIND